MNSIAAAKIMAPDGVEGVRYALKTDIIEILQSQINALSSMGRDQAYDAVMNNPQVLDGCFQIFRARPELFEQSVADANGRPAAQDDDLLSCGRTLSEAISLILRAAAKRYFRANASRVQGYDASDKHRAADNLYNSIKDHLLYEWQSRLIPSYIKMSVKSVEEIGKRLFDFREPAEIHALAVPDPADQALGRVPLLLDTADRVLVKGRETIDPEILWTVCQQMDLARLYPNQDTKALRTAVAQIAAAQSASLAPMVPVLGKDIRRFCVFLFVVHATQGAARFKTVYGEGGQSYFVKAWMERLRSLAVCKPLLSEMQSSYESVIDGAAH